MSSVARVLITGGSGFLGSHLNRTLSAAGWDVVIADVHEPAAIHRDNFLRLDVRNASAVHQAVRDVDAVVNSAALVPITRSSLQLYRAVNTKGTENVLTAAKASGAYVAHISSSSIYGIPTQLPIMPSTPFAPFEDYGYSKAEAEAVVERARAGGLVVSSLRPRTIVGTGRLGLFDAIFPRIRDGKAVPLFGSGDNVLQLLDVDDMCTAVVRAIETRSNGSYNVGAREYQTVRKDFEGLLAHANTGAHLVPVPVTLIHAVLRPLDAVGRSPFTRWHYRTAHKSCYSDISKTVNELGWSPKRSNLEALVNSYDGFVSDPVTSGASAHHQPLQGALARMLRG
jgi:nucleoside-diphosphate-sugar epimerase